MLLAGPILRKVDAKTVNVWIAADEDFDSDLSLKDDTTDVIGVSTTMKHLVGPGTPGSKLVISLLTFVPQVALQAGKVYSYNVKKKDGTSILTPLLTGDAPIGYSNNALPSFVLVAADRKDLIVAHGSCRKMHGDGPDAMPIIDKQIGDNLKDPAKRIQQLFLTGDQIYADEIPRFALWAITDKAKKLINGAEDLPLPKLTVDNVERPAIRISPADATPGFRNFLVNQYAKMTTGEGASHLMSFGEYCVAHLYAWSPDVWDPALKNAATNFSNIDANWADFKTKTQFGLDNYKNKEYLHPIPKTEFDERVKNFESFEKEQKFNMALELKEVANFLKGLGRVRRVMANTPTYMIFDDHEITDDWNISRDWKTIVYGNSLGKTVVRNGLMAYTLFQDLGNTPEEYAKTDSKKRSLIDQVKAYAAATSFADFSTDTIDQLLGLTTFESQPTVLWHYLVDSGPKVKTLFLDTRNRRGYSALNSRPELLDSAAFAAQFNFSNTPEADDMLFVISACPAIGLSVFEEMIYPIATSVKGLASSEHSFGAGQLIFDNEAWYLNSKAFEQLLLRMSAFKQVVLFSGDIHYGYTTFMDYWKKDVAQPASRFIQLVSTPLKNLWKRNIRLFQSGFVQGIFSGFGGKVEKFGWDNVPNVTGVDISMVNRRRLKESPSVIDNFGFKNTVTITPNPDWRYRLNVALDERADDIIENLPAEIRLADTFDHTKIEDIRKLAERFTADFKMSRSRRLMFANHICVVSFKDNKLQHSFNYRSADNEDTILKMVHEIPMAAPTAEAVRPELAAVQL